MPSASSGHVAEYETNQNKVATYRIIKLSAVERKTSVCSDWHSREMQSTPNFHCWKHAASLMHLIKHLLKKAEIIIKHDHRMFWFRRDLKDHIVPTPLPEAGLPTTRI